MATTKTKELDAHESRSNGNKSYRPPFTIKLNDVNNKIELMQESSDQSGA